MPWEEVEKGRFERPLGHTERLLWLIGASTLAYGRDEWHLFVAATVRTGTAGLDDHRVLSGLRESWQRLRFDHPSIATTTDGFKLTYQVPDIQTLEQWSKETFIVDAEAESVEDVFASVGPSSMAELHVLPASSQVILHTAHWRGDGRGIPQLFGCLLKHFAAALNGSQGDRAHSPWGDEVGRLSISLEEAANMTEAASEADQTKAEQMSRRILKAEPALTIPYLGTKDTAPAKPRRELLMLNGSQTAAIVAACKRKSLSVTAAVHAAIACTNIIHATSGTRHKEYRSSIRRDLRTRLPAPHNGSLSVAALYTMASMISIPSTHTWEGYAASLSQEYQEGYPDEQFRLHGVFNHQLVKDIEKMAEEDTTAKEPACDVDISSLGLLEKLVRREYGEGEGTIIVRDLGISINTSSRQAGIFVWTFRDCLHLYITYNDAYHIRSAMKDFLQDVEEILMRELDVTE